MQFVCLSLPSFYSSCSSFSLFHPKRLQGLIQIFFAIDIISLILKKLSVREHAVEDNRAFPLDVAIYLAHPLSWWISCCRGATTRSWQDKNTVGRVLVTVRWPVGFRERERERSRERKRRRDQSVRLSRVLRYPANCTNTSWCTRVRTRVN